MIPRMRDPFFQGELYRYLLLRALSRKRASGVGADGEVLE